VLRLREALSKERVYGSKLRALYRFLEELGLPERIAEKEASLRDAGDIQLADEYRQLWDIIVRALDQFYEVLGETAGSNAEFARLWKLLTSQYDIASIPVALDRVGLGELSRQRRRGLKCLVVIGATDDVLPSTTGGGLLSDGERRDIREYGIRLPGGAENAVTRAEQYLFGADAADGQLIVSYHTAGKNARHLSSSA
jgi:ATP-dependent helicase/nuclease subunit B